MSPTALVYPEFRTFTGRLLDPECAYYLVGLTDGEGCFSINNASCSFIIKVRDDDRPLLTWLQLEFEIGRINRESAPGGNRRAQARWVVSRKREVVWLTEFFDAFELRSKKAKDYAVWREAVFAWIVGELHSEAGFKERIRAARAYPRYHAIPGGTV